MSISREIYLDENGQKIQHVYSELTAKDFAPVIIKIRKIKEHNLQYALLNEFIDIAVKEKDIDDIKTFSKIEEIIKKKCGTTDSLISPYIMVEKLVCWFLLYDMDEENFTHIKSVTNLKSKSSISKLLKKVQKVISVYIAEYLATYTFPASNVGKNANGVINCYGTSKFLMELVKDPESFANNKYKTIIDKFYSIPPFKSNDERDRIFRKDVSIIMMKLTLVASLALSHPFANSLVNYYYDINDWGMMDSKVDYIRYVSAKFINTINELKMLSRDYIRNNVVNITFLNSAIDYLRAVNIVKNNGKNVNAFTYCKDAKTPVINKPSNKEENISSSTSPEMNKKDYKSNLFGVMHKDVDRNDYMIFIKKYILEAFNVFVGRKQNPAIFAKGITKVFPSVSEEEALHDIYMINRLGKTTTENDYKNFHDIVMKYSEETPASNVIIINVDENGNIVSGYINSNNDKKLKEVKENKSSEKDVTESIVGDKEVIVEEKERDAMEKHNNEANQQINFDQSIMENFKGGPMNPNNAPKNGVNYFGIPNPYPNEASNPYAVPPFGVPQKQVPYNRPAYNPISTPYPYLHPEYPVDMPQLAVIRPQEQPINIEFLKYVVEKLKATNSDLYNQIVLEFVKERLS